MDPTVKIDPEIMHGTPCSAGTRVPVKSLFDWLAGGETIDYFLESFPSVRREQALGLLETAREQSEAAARRAS